MSMFNVFKQLVKPSKILCQQCFQINSKSLFQSHHLNLKAIVRNFSDKVRPENHFSLGKNIVNRLITTKADTNVIKNVVLYSHINSRRTNIMLLFGITQSAFWYYLGYIIVTELRDVPVEGESIEDKNFFTKHNFGENKWKYSIGFICASLGTLAFSVAFLYSTRLITSIRLDKAGKTVTLLVSEDRPWRTELTLPLKHVSAMYSRSDASSFFPIKVKDRSFFYIIDLDGVVNNAVLFDVTVGTKRNFG